VSTPYHIIQTRQRLAHLEAELPVLMTVDGAHYLPLFPICQAIEVRPQHALRRVGHTLLWNSAIMLPLWWRERRMVAWSLPYAAALAWFLPQVFPLVRDPVVRRRVRLEMDAASAVMEDATRQVQARFETARRNVYKLAALASQLEQALEAAQRADLHGEPRALLEVAVAAARAILDQSQTFVREWTAKQAALPVVDAFQVDDVGNVVATRPMSLFGSASEQDSTRIATYLDACHQARQSILAALDEAG
jgi:hypothetical protein